MKMKKYINIGIVFLFVFLFSFPAFGQEDEKGSVYQHRYWHYRGRLKNDFMLETGGKPGESIPYLGRVGSHMYSTENPAGGIGQYIGVLAMEFFLLKKNNQDYSETLKDLYYSLYAINRLDIEAESYEWYGDIGDDICFFSKEQDSVQYMSGVEEISDCVQGVKVNDKALKNSLNGFFVRDDVYSKGYEQYKLDDLQDSRLNNSNDLNIVNEEGINSQFMKHKEQYGTGEYNGEGEGYCDEAETVKCKKYSKIEESQDEVVHYLYGLSLVIKYLDEDVTFLNRKFQDGETSLRLEARAIAARMMNWFADCPPGFVCENSEWYFGIMNPVTGKFVTDGCYTRGMSWGYYKAALEMGIELDGIEPESATAFIWKDIWMTDPYIPYSESFAYKMYCTLGAIGDSWGSTYNTMDVIENFFETKRRSKQFDSFLLYHYVLHGEYYDKFIKDKMGYFQDILRNAPCSLMESNYLSVDPIIYYPSTSFEWSGGDRGLVPKDRGKLFWNYNMHWYFSGLDYMFLMNMFYIAYGDVLDLSLSNQSNTIAYANNNYIQKDYPDEGIGSYDYPKVFKGFDEVSSNKVINSDGDVSFVAQNRIVLEPSFKAMKGCSFKASIDPVESHYYNCIPPIPTPESEIFVSNTKVKFKKKMLNGDKYALNFYYVTGVTDAYSYLISYSKKENEWAWRVIAEDREVGPYGNNSVLFDFHDEDGNQNNGEFYTYTTFFKEGEMTNKVHLGEFEAKKSNISELKVDSDQTIGVLSEDSNFSPFRLFDILSNPNNGSFRILVIDDRVENYDLIIISSTGSVVLDEKSVTTGKKEINLEREKKGIYFVNVVIDGKKMTKKVVVK